MERYFQEGQESHEFAIDVTMFARSGGWIGRL